ncbi:ATP-binding cassette domain-containing protein [Streptomyces sp. WMMC905]|uniref:ATP-binding cassette domain-containing protein n=1 Tax=Streptomyces sp. WMMC905 TaxID=3404123 RepID=UPI003B922FA6
MRRDCSMSLRLTDIQQGYSKTPVLRDINLELGTGITGLLGPNGAGKSTLLRTMATVLPPRSGSVEISGSQVESERSARQVRGRIGYLPQDFGHDPAMRVLDFVEYAAWLRGIPARQQHEAAVRALEHVDLVGLHRTKMGKLSGGQRQRAGIAWAVVGEPDVILLDEPTVGLDPQQRIQFRSIVKSLGRSTVVLSTHLTDDIDAVCDRVIVLNEGQISFDGTVSALTAEARDDLPGQSALERAYMHLLTKGK